MVHFFHKNALCECNIGQITLFANILDPYSGVAISLNISFLFVMNEAS